MSLQSSSAADRSSAPPTAFSAPRRALWLAAAVILVTGGLVALALVHLRTQAIESGQRLTASFAQLIEEQTTRSLQAVDQRLQLAAAGLDRLRAAGKLDEGSARAVLREQIEELPFVRAIWVMDAQGRIAYDSDTGNLGVDLSDRAYFQVYRQRPQTGFHLDAPVRSRSTGTWLISATRPLRSSAGAFEGIVVAAIEPPYFDRLWRTVDLGAGSAIALVRRDGVLMMRSPFDDAVVGKAYPNLRLFTQLPARPVAGSYQDTSAVDGCFVIWPTAACRRSPTWWWWSARRTN